ncbi:MAG: OadG family protein [Muribaculaceae bacterium]|nr:OadG family protein [Muribaculaceae bacterium]
MKKYIFSLVLAVGISLSPAFAQEEVAVSSTSEQPVVEQVTEAYESTWNAAQDSITIKEVSTGDFVVIDKKTYDDNVEKGYPIHKIFKNQLISDSDNSGMGVTLMSMCIVLFALILLSLLFLFFGKMFAKNQSKKKSEAKGESHVDTDDDEHDSGEVIAAIAMALDEHFNSKHDLEDTVLTIRRMKRAYSPWNSKIYNMRETPNVRRNR